MQFAQSASGWRVTFLDEGLRSALPGTFVFQSADKIVDMARKGGADMNLAGRQAIEQGIAQGRGGVWLSLTQQQYSKLTAQPAR